MLIREGKRDPRVRSLAQEIVSSVPAKNWIAEIEAIYEWTRENIRYVKDIDDVETVSPAWFLIDQARSGDCDDFCIVIGSLLGSIGHPTKLVAVGFRPGEYSHVYLETLIGRDWIPVDGIMNRGVGWSPPGVMQRMEIFN